MSQRATAASLIIIMFRQEAGEKASSRRLRTSHPVTVPQRLAALWPAAAQTSRLGFGVLGCILDEAAVFLRTNSKLVQTPADDFDQGSSTFSEPDGSNGRNEIHSPVQGKQFAFTYK